MRSETINSLSAIDILSVVWIEPLHQVNMKAD